MSLFQIKLTVTSKIEKNHDHNTELLSSDLEYIGYLPEETLCKLVMLKDYVRMRFFSTCTHTCKIEYSLQEI